MGAKGGRHPGPLAAYRRGQAPNVAPLPFGSVRSLDHILAIVRQPEQRNRRPDDTTVPDEDAKRNMNPVEREMRGFGDFYIRSKPIA